MKVFLSVKNILDGIITKQQAEETSKKYLLIRCFINWKNILQAADKQPTSPEPSSKFCSLQTIKTLLKVYAAKSNNSFPSHN